MRRHPGRRAIAALALACAATGSAALACGLEDPTSAATQRGVLALAYPQSPQVGTAVWQATDIFFRPLKLVTGMIPGRIGMVIPAART